MSEKITVHYEGKPCYPIVIENSYDKLPEYLGELNISNRRVCIVTETTVAKYYLEIVQNVVTPLAKQVVVFTFPAGEANKNLNVVQELYETLILAKFDRKDLLIALGGGVVGDLTGYTAATYLRGIDFVQMPTSLLSQVDSSIGGKTGVDFSAYKNMVGAFHQPKLVYMNVHTLDTLTEREYLSGMGEIVKHGLIQDSAYYNWLQENADAIIKRDENVLIPMIAKSCQIKRYVVENDPKEQGIRALLNFGHTLGHAIEKCANFQLLHGECVGVGMILASYLSMQKGLINRNDFDNICKTIYQFKLIPALPEMDLEEVVQTTLNDKKMDAGLVKFILLEQIGTAIIDKSITLDDMRDAMKII